MKLTFEINETDTLSHVHAVQSALDAFAAARFEDVLINPNEGEPVSLVQARDTPTPKSVPAIVEPAPAVAQTVAETSPAVIAQAPDSPIVPDVASPVETAADVIGSGVAVEVDAFGRPWDARIHSSAKSRLAKTNGWKLIRGIDKALVASVEAELDLAKMNAQAVAAAPAVAQAVAAAPAVAQAVAAAPAVAQAVAAAPAVAQAVAAAPAVAQAVAAAPAVAQAGPITFAVLMGRAQTGKTSGEITPTALAEASARHGVAQPPMLGIAANAHLIPIIYSELFPNG